MRLETAEGTDHNRWTNLEDDKCEFRDFHLILRSDKTDFEWFSHTDEAGDPDGADAINPHHPDYYCCTIVYDWRPEFEDTCRAWLHNFAAGDDGHAVTAESDGCFRCDLLVTADESALRTGFHEEWNSQKSQLKYAGVRIQAGFVQKWSTFRRRSTGPNSRARRPKYETGTCCSRQITHSSKEGQLQVGTRIVKCI